MLFITIFQLKNKSIQLFVVVFLWIPPFRNLYIDPLRPAPPLHPCPSSRMLDLPVSHWSPGSYMPSSSTTTYCHKAVRFRINKIKHYKTIE